jgi:hypothetical protein
MNKDDTVYLRPILECTRRIEEGDERDLAIVSALS